MLGTRKKAPLTLGLGGPSQSQKPEEKRPETQLASEPEPPAAPAAPFSFGQKPAPVEVFVDPSLFNLVEQTKAEPPKNEAFLERPRFRPLAPTSIRIPEPGVPTARRIDEWAAAPASSSFAVPQQAPANPVRPVPASQALGQPFNQPLNRPAPEVKTSSRPIVGGPSAPEAPKPKPAAEKPPAQKTAPRKAAEPKPAQSDTGAYEIVLGRRQIAGLLFMVTALMMLSASAAYLVGKSAPRKSSATVIARVAAQPGPTPVPVPKPVATASSGPTAASPIFASPVRGKQYLQVTAVEKGMAEVIAQGFRSRGLDAFAAPTASPKVFRVLIGPLTDQASYLRAKDTVDDLGLSAFAHRFQE